MQELLGLPPEASAHAHEIDGSIALIHWLMLALFVGWSAFYLYSLIRFRRSKNPAASYTGLKSRIPFVIVGAVALFEGVVLAGFDLPLWAKLVRDIPAEKDATVVRVVAEQFAWNVHYPGPDGVFGRTDIALVSSENPLGLDRNDPAAKDDITTINQLTLPVGKPVVVRLSSKDVIHSFGIPYFRVKQDAVPGQSVRVSFTPTKTSEEILAEVTHSYRIDRSTSAEKFNVFVAMAEYRDKDGAAILSKGDQITQDALGKLLDAGVNDVVAGPYSPIEVACSQLCGLGHFRMRATVSVLTPEAYQTWLADQAAALAQ
jgi:cytochrome c oxidase subunit II